MLNIFNLLSSSSSSAENLGDNLIVTLNVFWKGMLAIIAVVGIIIAVTYLMQFISKKAENRKKQSESKPDLKSDDQ